MYDMRIQSVVYEFSIYKSRIKKLLSESVCIINCVIDFWYPILTISYRIRLIRPLISKSHRTLPDQWSVSRLGRFLQHWLCPSQSGLLFIMSSYGIVKVLLTNRLILDRMIVRSCIVNILTTWAEVYLKWQLYVCVSWK